jgi:hypothetical protein
MEESTIGGNAKTTCFRNQRFAKVGPLGNQVTDDGLAVSLAPVIEER